MDKLDKVPLVVPCVTIMLVAIYMLCTPSIRGYFFGTSSENILSLSKEQAVENYYKDVCSALYEPLARTPMVVTEAKEVASGVEVADALYGDVNKDIRKTWIKAFNNLPHYAPEPVTSPSASGEVDLQKTLDTIRAGIKADAIDRESLDVITVNEQSGDMDIFGQREAVKLLRQDAHRMGVDTLFTVQIIPECQPVFPEAGTIDQDAVRMLVAYSQSDSYYRRGLKVLSSEPGNINEMHIMALEWQRWCLRAADEIEGVSDNDEIARALWQSYRGASGVGKSVAEDVRTQGGKENIHRWFATLQGAADGVVSSQLRFTAKYDGVNDATRKEVNNVLKAVSS